MLPPTVNQQAPAGAAEPSSRARAKRSRRTRRGCAAVHWPTSRHQPLVGTCTGKESAGRLAQTSRASRARSKALSVNTPPDAQRFTGQPAATSRSWYLHRQRIGTLRLTQTSRAAARGPRRSRRTRRGCAAVHWPTSRHELLVAPPPIVNRQAPVGPAEPGHHPDGSHSRPTARPPLFVGPRDRLSIGTGTAAQGRSPAAGLHPFSPAAGPHPSSPAAGMHPSPPAAAPPRGIEACAFVPAEPSGPTPARDLARKACAFLPAGSP
jgi:hypothetical protein